MIDPSHLQRIEVGDIIRPDYETLVALLVKGLPATFPERRMVLKAFDYHIDTPLPDTTEIAAAIAQVEPELRSAMWPAYLVHCGQRILHWNALTPRLLGLRTGDSRMEVFRGVTTFAVALDPRLGVTERIADRARFLQEMLWVCKAELSEMVDEAWYQELIAEARPLPGFSAIWDSIQSDTLGPVGANGMHVQLEIPEEGVLAFRITGNDFIEDPRFRVVHYIPESPETMRACARWAEETVATLSAGDSGR